MLYPVVSYIFLPHNVTPTDPRNTHLCCFMFQLGIAIVNDFKSVEGDKALGLQVLTLLHVAINK